MMRKWFVIVVGVTALSMGPAAERAAAQDSNNESSSAASDSTEDGGGAKGNESSTASGDDSAESDDGGTAETAEESSSDTKKKGDKEKEKTKDGETKTAKKGEGSGESESKRGPGGKKMREDYPGTEGSKKEQMETDRIEGLQFEEGQNPSKAYDVKIQEIETEIDNLKEDVFQSKSRVVLLKETVLGGNLSGSRAMIVHSDKLGSQFQLKRAMYSLNGNRVFNESTDSGGLKGGKNKFRVYDSSIGSGSHNVSILLEYQGSGFGIFNYMKGYNVEIQSSCQFNVKPGRATIIRVHTVKKGGAFERGIREPGIKCEIEKSDLSKQRIEKNKKKKDKKNKSDGQSGAKSSGDNSGK